MAITTAAEYAASLNTTPSTGTPDWNTVKLAYIDMIINQLKTQTMLVTQHPLF
jgi:NADPH-dependent 7-cyano-7-deazaguanine reductase QueF